MIQVTHSFKNSQLILLNLILIAGYFILMGFLGISVTKDFLFSTTDSVTYLNVTNWFSGLSDFGHARIRPILYPLILLIFYKGFGSFGIWGLQFLCWLLSINLVFITISKWTGRQVYGFIGAGLMALNFTFFFLTFHALTEVLTVFLLSILIYFITVKIDRVRDFGFFQGCLLILVLLTILKPLFYPVVLFLLLVIFPVYYLKKKFLNPRNLLVSLLILTPLVLQIGLMKIKYDSLNVSNIGSNTFRDYFYADGLHILKNISYEDALKLAQQETPDERLKNILANKALFMGLYFVNLKSNIASEPIILNVPYPHKTLHWITFVGNRIVFFLHLLFLIPVLLTLIRTYRNKQFDHFIFLSVVATLLYIILITSGISFWQGDRLVLPALPLWITLYLLVFNYWHSRMSG